MKVRVKLAVLTAIVVVLQHGLGWAWGGYPKVVLAAPAEASLVKIVSHPAVYYVGRDGRRYVFPNEATHFSWYHNFDGVQVGSSVVAFSGNGAPQAEGSYVATGATEHTLVNLVPNATYLMTVQNADDGSTVTTVAFTASAVGTATVSGTPSGQLRFIFVQQ